MLTRKENRMLTESGKIFNIERVYEILKCLQTIEDICTDTDFRRVSGLLDTFYRNAPDEIMLDTTARVLYNGFRDMSLKEILDEAKPELNSLKASINKALKSIDKLM